MTDHPLPLQIQHIFHRSLMFCGLQIRLLVNTVKKPKVNVIGPQLFQLPCHRAFDLIQLQSPSVFPAAVIRSEMYLKIYLVPAA